jgi:hypothetical protein
VPQSTVPTFKQGERLSAAKLNELAGSLASILRHRFGFGTAEPKPIVGKLDGNLVAATAFDTTPATATMSVWVKNSSGNLVDSGRNETVVNRLLNITTITTGTVVYAKWVEGEWTVFIADC